MADISSLLHTVDVARQALVATTLAELSRYHQQQIAWTKEGWIAHQKSLGRDIDANVVKFYGDLFDLLKDAPSLELVVISLHAAGFEPDCIRYSKTYVDEKLIQINLMFPENKPHEN